MTPITFYFDVLSPYAFLAFERLPQALEGVSHAVRHQPVLLAGLLQHHGQKGPAEIEPKRAWAFRHVHWLAQRHGVVLQTPAQHPFNPLALLRLAVAAAPEGGTPDRWVCEQLMRHVWQGGGLDANAPDRLQALRRRLDDALVQRGRALRDPDSPAVKQELRHATDQAIAQGVFGVPHLQADGRLYWGLEGLEMLAAALKGDAFFEGPLWDEAAAPRGGVVRRPSTP